jgi:hypothetical protein
MDPRQALIDAIEAWDADDLEEASDVLDGYEEWRARDGFEPAMCATLRQLASGVDLAATTADALAAALRAKVIAESTISCPVCDGTGECMLCDDNGRVPAPKKIDPLNDPSNIHFWICRASTTDEWERVRRKLDALMDARAERYLATNDATVFNDDGALNSLSVMVHEICAMRRRAMEILDPHKR